MNRRRSFAPEKDIGIVLKMLHNISVMLEEVAHKRDLLGTRTVVLDLITSDFIPLTNNVTEPDGGTVSTAAEFAFFRAESSVVHGGEQTTHVITTMTTQINCEISLLSTAASTTSR